MPWPLHSDFQIAELTSMVNNRNKYLDILSGLTEPPASDTPPDHERDIKHDGPLWRLSDVVGIVSGHTETSPRIRLVTEDAINDHAELVEQGFCLVTAVCHLNKTGRYLKSVWCKTSPIKINGKYRGEGVWIPCDAYKVNCAFKNPHNGYSGTNTYYLKLCMGLNGDAVLFVSAHL